jgi:hypothetical protein
MAVLRWPSKPFSALPELYLAPLAAYAERAIRGLNVI